MVSSSTEESKAAAFRKAQHTAFVVGATGEVGKEIVKALAEKDLFKKVLIIGRRNIDLPEGPGASKMEQHIIDFDNIEESKKVFEGADIGFCALGTTRGKSGVEGFIKVDHDYVVNVAKVAKEAGLKHYHVVTSTGSNPRSPMLYPKTKGRAEEDLKALSLEKLSIYRPGVLLCKRNEARPLDTAGKLLLAPIAAVAPTLLTIPTTTVGKGLVNNAVLKVNVGMEVLENRAIHLLAKANIE